VPHRARPAPTAAQPAHEGVLEVVAAVEGHHGSVAADRGPLRWTFGLGAALASLCWFAALGFGARLLGRFLARPAAWRVLDGLIAATMITLGALLIAGA
jgi:arginine exporter protein ArgO